MVSVKHHCTICTTVVDIFNCEYSQNYYINQCLSFIYRNEFSKHLEQVYGKLSTLNCPKCTKHFSTYLKLSQHNYDKHQQGEYACSQPNCDFKSNLPKAVRDHLSNNHNTFSCSYCSKPFNRQFNLHQHLRIHTKETPFPCPRCDKSFNQKIHLDVHVRTHTQERPYRCTECGKTFIQKSHLNTHQRYHSNERRFICDQCSKAFIDNSTLQKHRRTHGNNHQTESFRCNWHCSYTSNLQSNVLSHIRQSHFHASTKTKNNQMIQGIIDDEFDPEQFCEKITANSG